MFCLYETEKETVQCSVSQWETPLKWVFVFACKGEQVGGDAYCRRKLQVYIYTSYLYSPIVFQGRWLWSFSQQSGLCLGSPAGWWFLSLLHPWREFPFASIHLLTLIRGWVAFHLQLFLKYSILQNSTVLCQLWKFLDIVCVRLNNALCLIIILSFAV